MNREYLIMIKILKKNEYFFFLFFLFLIIGGIIILWIPKEEISIFINSHHNNFFDRLFYYLTALGNGWFYVVVIMMFVFYKFYYSLIGIVSFALTSSIAQFLKNFIFDDSDRPRKLLEKIQELHFVKDVEVHFSNSFPSGHSVTAFSVFCLLSLFVKNKKWGIVFLIMAILIGFSRIYLVQHFITDVYAGSFIGIIVTVIVFYYFENSAFLQNWGWLHKSLMK